MHVNEQIKWEMSFIDQMNYTGNFIPECQYI